VNLLQHLFYWVTNPNPNLFLLAWVWLAPTPVVHVDRIHLGALGLALLGRPPRNLRRRLNV
jgi:hypothetical protein